MKMLSRAAAPLTAAVLCLASQPALADDCDAPLSEESHQALVCVQTALDRQKSALQARYDALRSKLPGEEASKLDRDQASWASFVEADCEVFTDMAGGENDTWRQTWGEIALNACRVEMMSAREERLGQYQALVKRRGDQRAAIFMP
ncbi:lysozyme inhibitor LprI family protein [Bordetella avium]|uniref:Exported protein n=1 Tax=Bordetella avium (strain 197N) TaxID=360910 RepID=Q2L1X9_BORA1|nr:lysozyme inhibitor LprI family protein [Bordetella avium]CAJ49166.1 putative exported protein [Bordetella avium 197N]